MKKNFKPPQMTMKVLYSDGYSDAVSGSADVIRLRFSNFVAHACYHYLDGFKEVQLIDCANHVFKSYIQHF